MNKTLKLCYTAALTALCVVANTFTIPLNPTGSQALSFVYFICFVAGIYLGWLPAAFVGFFGDLLGHLIHPMGIYNPLIGLSCLLLGVIPALVWKLKWKQLPKLALSLALCLVVCTAALNSSGLYLLVYLPMQAEKGTAPELIKSFWVYMLGRMTYQAPIAVGNVALVYVLLKTKVVDKMILRAEQSFASGQADKAATTTPEKNAENVAVAETQPDKEATAKQTEISQKEVAVVAPTETPEEKQIRAIGRAFEDGTMPTKDNKKKK